MNILNLFKAIKAGEELSNPAAWKNFQSAVNAVLIILGVVTAFLPDTVTISETELQHIAEAVVVIGAAIFNTWATMATSRKVGIGGKKK